MLRTAELDVSAVCVAEGVFTLCLFPVIVAVVQQRFREVGSCSLDVRVRCCRMQGRRGWRRVRLKVGRGRRQASRGKTTRRGRRPTQDRRIRWRDQPTQARARGMVGRRGQPTQAHARDGTGRGDEPARVDEVDAKIVWVRHGGGARYILFNGRERQAGEEVGVSDVLSSSI